MAPSDYSDKYCVIGAGSSGLAAAKNLRQYGIPFDCLEREDDVGGNWYYGRPHSSVYQSTHLISSKRLTEYTDFPMPDSYPDYPGHAQVWEYLRAYARAFDLYDTIEFNASVDRIEPAGAFWDVTLASGQTRRYRGIVIANGHNWDPKWPVYPGQFRGRALHSADYKTPDLLTDKRVLVVGAGNSGCDIAVESVQHAARTFLSVRRGYHYLPKYLFGRPSDIVGERLLRRRVPLWLRRRLTLMAVKLALGEPQDYGLPKPDHRLYETHPIINSEMLYHVGHGRIAVKPDVAELCGDRVLFVDGSAEAIDVIIYATGFKISFPFIDREHLNWKEDRPELYLNVFHPTNDHLFIIGLIQPDSGQFGLVDYQAQLVARYLGALRSDPARAARFRERKRRGTHAFQPRIRYLDSTRHLLEVEHYRYCERLRAELALFD